MILYSKSALHAMMKAFNNQVSGVYWGLLLTIGDIDWECDLRSYSHKAHLFIDARSPVRQVSLKEGLLDSIGPPDCRNTIVAVAKSRRYFSVDFRPFPVLFKHRMDPSCNLLTALVVIKT